MAMLRSALRSAGALLTASLIWGAGLQFPTPAWGESAISCGAPLEAGGEWPTASPEEAGLDPETLCSLNEALDKSPDTNVHAVLAVRGGRLVYEAYRGGRDQVWGRMRVISHGPQTEHDVRSLSKSVVSLLFGIALDRKLIASIEEPVFRYFPEYAALRTPEKDRILLRHLLNMRSGLAWNELSVPYSDPTSRGSMVFWKVEPYRFVLEQPVQHEPDEEWNYNSGNTELLAGVLQKATGKPLAEFAR